MKTFPTKLEKNRELHLFVSTQIFGQNEPLRIVALPGYQLGLLDIAKTDMKSAREMSGDGTYSTHIHCSEYHYSSWSLHVYKLRLFGRVCEGKCPLAPGITRLSLSATQSAAIDAPSSACKQPTTPAFTLQGADDDKTH
jgi:hypothetical protein